METWYEGIDGIKTICLWTDEEPFYQSQQQVNSLLTGPARFFAGYTHAALNTET